METNYDKLTISELRDAAAHAIACFRSARNTNQSRENADRYCTICDLISERLEIELSLKMY